METLGLILISLVLLAANAFFVLSEFAFVKVRPTQLDELAATGDTTAKLARKIRGQLDDYLSTIQLGITIASLGIGWLGEPALATLIHPLIVLPAGWDLAITHTLAFALAFSLITMLHVILGELAPKSLAIRSPEWYSLRCARPLHLMHITFYIPMRLMTSMSNAILRVFGLTAAESEYDYSAEELKRIMGHSYREGNIGLADLILFENLFDFSHMTLKDAMRPFAAVELWQPDLPPAENLSRLAARRRSRFPVASAAGIPTTYVHIKDMVFCRDLRLEPPLRPLITMTADTPIADAFRQMQKSRSHLALVLDPAGRPAGLVSAEDIIEEIFGEIRDEFETAAQLSLRAIFEPAAADLALPHADKYLAMKHLLQRLCRSLPGHTYERILELVLAREQQFPTAIGHGIAMPHARVADLSRPLFTIGLRPSGITYEAPDQVPVRAIFLLLTPASEPNLQVKILARLAQLLADPGWRDRIMKAASPGELAEILDVFDQMTIS